MGRKQIEGAEPAPKKQPQPPNVPSRPNILSRITFWFVGSLVRYGHSTTLAPNDLYKSPAVETGPLHHMFEVAWQKELKKGNPRIVRAVAANCTWGLVWTGLLYVVSMGCQLVGPQMLQRIVAGLQCWAKQAAAPDTVCPTTSYLYYLVIALSLAPLVQSVVENQMMFQLNVLGTRMRNGLMAAIFRKCLVLSNTALQSESTGKVVTLMSNDAQKVQEVMLGIHTLWGAPALIVVILVLLYQQVGWACFIGLGVMIAYTPLSTLVSKKLLGFRRGLLGYTDKRVGLMNEVINGMQMIKFYAWERSFRADIMAARNNEARILKSMVWWQGLFGMLLFSGPVAMAVFCFASYAAAGNVFSAAQAYTALALFNLLRLPLAFLPMMITAVVNAMVALQRISEFLVKPEAGTAALREAAKDLAPGTVQVEAGDFTWDPTLPTPSLRGVNLDVAPGSLTMVVGSVGSGKSSLLGALIGQMDRVAGRAAVGGSVAYVAQVAWIINDSVQENVVLGGNFDAPRYAHAVQVSQLLPDLAMLPNHDATEIGDRGVTLSGGQKQRVAIARAVYADADVYLLDDPLSAVDSHVGRAIFEQVICTTLRGKTVVLVTNALQYLPAADNIVWMEGGAVKAQGRYSDLVAAGLNIAELVHLEEEEEDTEEEGGSQVDAASPWVVREGEGASNRADTDEPGTPFTTAASVWVGDVPVSHRPQQQHQPPPTLPEGVALTGPGQQAVPRSIAAAAAAAPDVATSRLQHTTLPGNTAATIDALLEEGPAGSGDSSSSGKNSPAARAQILTSQEGAADLTSAAGLLQHSPQQQPPSPGPRKGADLMKQAGSTGASPRAAAASNAHRTPSWAKMRKTPSMGSLGGGRSEGEEGEAGALRHVSMVRLATEANRNLTGVEERSEGIVKGRVLWAYVAAAGGLLVAVAILALFAVEQGSRVFTDTWLGFWTSNAFNQVVWFYIGIYAALGIFYSLVTFVRSIGFLYTTVNASLSLHNQLLDHILRLPKTFFDTNPAGRILNRFSRDVEVMDSVLNQSMVQFMTCFATFVSILVVISLATRWFAIAILPITAIYVALQRYYIPAARELQRIESISRSPIYSRFSEALAGVATIRAYRRERHFTDANDNNLQHNAYAYITQRAAASWLALRLDMIGVCIITAAACLCINGAISPGLAGLCLVYSLDLTRYLKHGTAMASKTESDFNSVERVVQYLDPPTEAAEETSPEVAATMPKDWPSGGAISVEKLVLRYRPGLPLVLKGVSFEVAPGEKVGLVGRTGSGKSSLLLALFRMVEPVSGRVLLDGVDIGTVGLTHLRSVMSIIPQDPFMFSGTVRHNLDPFSNHQDAQLWEVITAVGLKPTISDLPLKLEAPVVDNGANFSQGQKQLFCMARAMLRASRVLMLDEATASVDPESDALLQAVIRQSFADTTMLTIAHRLNTIMDADRVLVMDQGLVVENDEPHALLQRDAGIFTGMVQQTGAASATYLREVARSASVTRQGRVASLPALRGLRSEVLGAPYMASAAQQAYQAQQAATAAAGGGPGGRDLGEAQTAWQESQRNASMVGSRGGGIVTDPVGSYMAAPMRLGQELEALQERASGELGEAGRRGSRELREAGRRGSRDSRGS